MATYRTKTFWPSFVLKGHESTFYKGPKGKLLPLWLKGIVLRKKGFYDRENLLLC